MTEPAVSRPDSRAQQPSARYLRHDAELRRLQSERGPTPPTVSFRQMVGPIPVDDATHSVHPYPARLIRHIPRFFFESSVIPQDGVVVDPFCGSGTVLLEALLSGRRAVGVDSNPVATLISAVKTSPLDTSKARLAALVTSVDHAARRGRAKYEPASYARKWYSDDAFSGLQRLATTVSDHAAGASPVSANLLRLALARTSLEISIRDPRIPVPVRSRGSSNTNATAEDARVIFRAVFERLVALVARLPAHLPAADVVRGDSRSPEYWPELAEDQPSVLFTSPPYGAAQKYVRSTSLEAAWLGHAGPRGTRDLERASIGREHLDPREVCASVQLPNSRLRELIDKLSALDARRGAIYMHYFADMSSAIATGLSQLRPDMIVLVCGTNRVAGTEVSTHDYLAEMIRSHGYTSTLELKDEIRGRTLMTRRRSGGLPAPSEMIYVFNRDEGATATKDERIVG